jgi:hypothetical protein
MANNLKDTMTRDEAMADWRARAEHDPNAGAPANAVIALRRRQAQQRLQEHEAPGLDDWAMALSPVPVLGDLAGLGADAYDWVTNPESRNSSNAMLIGMGVLPGVPPLAAAGRKAKTAAEEAHEVARQNAVAKLGLPEDNTAMDRARAMGFNIDRPMYHSTKNEFDAFSLDPPKGSRRGTDFGIHAGTPEAANEAIVPEFVERNLRETAARPDLSADMKANQLRQVDQYYENARVLPLVAKGDKPLEVPDFGRWDNPGNALHHIEANSMWGPARLKEGLPTNDPEAMQEILELAKSAERLGWDETNPAWKKGLNDILERRGYSHIEYANKTEGDGATSYMFTKPENLRSRFAAFDPAKAHLPELLGGIAAGGVGLNAFLQERERERE